MTDKQPEALRLAYIIEANWDRQYGKQAAAELRRLHEVNAELLEARTRKWQGLTDEEILADDVLRYHFGLNGGAGPVSKKGKAVIAAIEAKLKEKNT